MEANFFKSRFSTHFNRLTYLGMWSAEMLLDPLAKRLYFAYRLFWIAFLIFGIAVQMVDLYFVFGNLRKVTYNFCTSVIVIGIAIKVVLLYDRKKYLNRLRLSLWRDSLKLNTQEAAIQDLAYAQLKNIRNCFYLAAVILLPIWIVSSYFSYKWGPRHLAFAAYLPLPDPLNDLFYVPALAYQALSGFYVIFLVIEVELAMFSVVLQVKAYYQILIKNILKLNDIYGEENEERRKLLSVGSCRVEVNFHLKKQSAQKLLKLLIIRQLEILKYSKNFEFIFSRCMILQMFAGSLLIVMNGLELSLFMHELSMKLCFQTGYVVLIMVDLLFICYHLSRLSAESLNVGNAAYSTVWYKMDVDVRKSLCMIMVRSQKPPRITAGKLFLMDLTTYLHMLRNIYSWLMLFRQLEVK